jgi:DNA polymerase elongation subunit (family B)
MLKVLAKGKSAAEAKELVPRAIEVLLSYGRATKSGLVPVGDLLFERQVSKSPSAYINRTPQTTAARLLIESGASS